MKLTFEQFRKKISETKQKIARAIAVREGAKLPGKKSQTRLRAERRAWKTRPQAACDSFRWRHQHNHHPSGRLHGWGANNAHKKATGNV